MTSRLSSFAAGLAFNLYKRVASPVVHGLGVSQCIFLPTCSELRLRGRPSPRLVSRNHPRRPPYLRCRPFATGGLDPVP